MYTLRPFILQNQIMESVKNLAEKISLDYHNQTLICIGLLRGSFIFQADLIRALNIETIVDFMVVSSYGEETVSSKEVKIIKDIQEDIEDQHVLIIEDIVDTGYTLTKVLSMLELRNPKSLKVCTLLDKPDRREVSIVPEYIGLTIPDHFVVGYGLDYGQKHRGLKDICIVDFNKE